MQENDITLSGFKINNIADRLTLDMMQAVDNHGKSGVWSENRFLGDLIIRLSRSPYPQQLLFQNFSADDKEPVKLNGHPDTSTIRPESLTYVTQVMVLKRLQIAPVLMEKPGNMHLLLKQLLDASSESSLWNGATILRRKEYDKTDNKNDQVSRKLKEICASLGAEYSENSARRREEFGPLWMITENQAEELPEEMTLCQTLSAVQYPLTKNWRNHKEAQKLFSRVMVALNERYKLLRSCGLDPEKWIDRGELVTNKLNALAELRRLSRALVGQEVADEKKAYEKDKAYEKAFETLKGKKKNFAGYTSFLAFQGSDVGADMMRQPTDSPELTLDPTSGELGPDEADQQAAEKYNQQKIETSITNNPDLFVANPVMEYYFRYALGQRIPVLEEEGGLLSDPHFSTLLMADPEYAELDRKERAKKLYQNAKEIIKRGKIKWTRT